MIEEAAFQPQSQLICCKLMHVIKYTFLPPPPPPSTPYHKNPCIGGLEINNFDRFYLDHHSYIYLICLIHTT